MYNSQVQPTQMQDMYNQGAPGKPPTWAGQQAGPQSFGPPGGPAIPPQSNSQPWMAMPTGVIGCPPGLEYLSQVDQLLVHQQVELFEAFTGFQTENKYAIKNSLGQQCYFASEESETCMRICCESDRGFVMHIVDNTGHEVMRVTRPFKLCGGCCWCANADCCSHCVEVEAPVGTVIGRIKQSQSFWVPYYDVEDANGKRVFKIQGPCCVCPGPCCTCDFPFDVYTNQENEGPIGRISKQYSGLVKEMFTNATNFSVTFPMDLDTQMKAVLLGATFLIDLMFFEENNNDDDC